MIDILLIFLCFLGIFWYWKSSKHPESFPPGPRRPLPIIGDGYVLGGDLAKGLGQLKNTYGNIFGLWLGKQRCVCVADFEVLQELLNRSEASNRQNTDSSCKLCLWLFNISEGIFFLKLINRWRSLSTLQ